MPWKNVPKEKWPQMERCVKDLKAQGKNEQSANAICYTSIIGNKKKIDSADGETNMEGGEKNTSVEKTDENTMTKTEEKTSVSKTDEETLKAMDADMKACVMGHMKEGKAMADAKALCEKAMEGKKVAKADEEAEAPVEEEVKAEEVIADKEEAVVEEEKVEAPVEEATEEVVEDTTADAVVEDTTADAVVEEADAVGDLVKQVLSKVEEIQASLKKEDPAPNDAGLDSVSAEGAADPAPDGAGQEAPEVPAENTTVAETVENAVVEETPAEADGSSEGTEEVAKISDSLTKISSKLDNLEKRINALEEQPVPSKIVSPKTVTKGKDSDVNSNPRVEEIKTELSKIMEMRTKNTEQYQKERGWEKAFDLIAERDNLQK